MARIRTIKPEFFMDEETAELSACARLAFIGLWTLADGHGRMEDKPRRLKVQLFPYETVDFDAILNDLAAGNFIYRYEVDGKRYIEVRNFSKHQRLSGKEATEDSQFPPYPGSKGKQRGSDGEAIENATEFPTASGKERKGKEREGGEKETVKRSGNSTTPKPETASRFTPPTEDQVREYMARATGPIQPADRDREAGRFRNYHEAKGWKVGTQPMRSWEAAVRTWEGNYKPPARASSVTAEEAREMARL